jgi:NhaP-type Na+/H+ and K+/H+ antiporter
MSVVVIVSFRVVNVVDGSDARRLGKESVRRAGCHRWVVADGHLILEGGLPLAAGLVASLIATRVRVPGLVLFLGLGMLVGSDALGWIAFDNYRLARPAERTVVSFHQGLGWVAQVAMFVTLGLLGSAGLRGAVPVVLATFPVIAHVPRSLQFFNIVCFAVLVSTLFHGATFEMLAARLGLMTSGPPLAAPLAAADPFP